MPFLITRKQIINIIFKNKGAAAAAANLLCEFKIAEKKDAILIKNKNGKVILVKSTAKLNFSSKSEKPGAINFTKLGIKISTSIVRLKSAKTNKLNTEFANF